MQTTVENNVEQKRRRRYPCAFDDLPKDVQEQVLEKTEWRYMNVDHDGWADFMVEGFKEDLEELGFCDAEVYYSGFSSQGDGASFKCNIDMGKFIEKHLEELIRAGIDIFYLRAFTNSYCVTSGEIKQGGHYCHAYTMSASIQISWDEGEPKGIDEDDANNYETQLEDFILETAREKANEFYKRLEEEYDYQTSDEAVRETIRCNEYRFDRDGDQVHKEVRRATA